MAKKVAAAGPVEGPWALPDGWRWERLPQAATICDHLRRPINNTERLKRNEGKAPGELYPYYGATGQAGVIDGYLADGDYILLGEDGAPFLDRFKTKAYAVSGRFWVNNHAHVLMGKPHLDARLLLHWLNTIKYEPFVNGTTRLKLTQGAMMEMPVPVPPADVQSRLASRIDELFGEIENGEAALARARGDLATWRKTLLKAAVTGELTADWRTANPPAETGADLLARILDERRARWEARKGKQNAALPLPETEGLPELPDSWTWATLEQVASSEANAIADGPFGSNLKSSHYTDRGPRVLRLQNIGRDGSFIDAAANIGQGHFDNLGRHQVNAGDLVIAILGEPVPRAVIVPPSVGPALVKADCIKVRLDNRVNAKLIWAWLNSIVAHFRFEHEVKGVGRPRLSMSHVRGMPVPIAPTQEQPAITQRVEAGLLSIEEAAQAIADQEIAAATLRQSILAAAFRGELA